MTCAPSKDSDQPGHPPSLIRVHCPLEETLGPQLPIKCNSEYSDQAWRMPRLQTGQMLRLICLRWVHMPFCWFCHEAAQMNRIKQIITPIVLVKSDAIVWPHIPGAQQLSECYLFFHPGDYRLSDYNSATVTVHHYEPFPPRMGNTISYLLAVDRFSSCF